MSIADKKKQNNIAEYIIHMYQTEDLIRAFDCDIEQVKAYVIKHIPQDDDSKDDIIKWYEEILDKMKAEGILSSGHLNETQTIVSELEELKTRLVSVDKEFRAVYTNAKPHINEMLKLADGKVVEEVQICVNGIYGLLLAKINGREVPEEIQPTLDEFGNVLSYLSYKYKQENFLSEN